MARTKKTPAEALAEAEAGAEPRVLVEAVEAASSDQQRLEVLRRHIKEQVEFKVLRVPLSDEERRELGGELAEESRALEQLEDEKSQVAAQYASRIKERRGAIRMTANILHDGFRPAHVKCRWMPTVDLRMECVREDTGEVIESRKLAEWELQMKLFTVDEAPKQAPVAEDWDE